MTILDKLNTDIISAMKSKEKVLVLNLKAIKNHIINKTKAAKKDLASDEEIVSYLIDFYKLRNKTIATYKDSIIKAPAQAELAKLKIEEETIERDLTLNYLPQKEKDILTAKPKTDDALKVKISEIIKENGISLIKEFGKLMGLLSKEFKGDEMKRANIIAREILN